MDKKTKHSPLRRPERKQAVSWTLEEAWDNCTGQCGADPWCSVCMREKERLHEEELNRRSQAVDNKE